MNGNVFLLKKDGVTVAAVQTNDIDTACGLLEVAGKSQGKSREYTPDKKEWSMTVKWLLLSTAAMAALLQSGQVFSMELYDRNHVQRTVYGQAYLEQCNLQTTVENIAYGTFKFRGNAALLPTYTTGDFNNDFNNDFKLN